MSGDNDDYFDNFLGWRLSLGVIFCQLLLLSLTFWNVGLFLSSDLCGSQWQALHNYRPEEIL
jgi:hypothetical protein